MFSLSRLSLSRLSMSNKGLSPLNEPPPHITTLEFAELNNRTGPRQTTWHTCSILNARPLPVSFLAARHCGTHLGFTHSLNLKPRSHNHPNPQAALSHS